MIATMVDPAVRDRSVLLRRAFVGLVVMGLLGGLLLAYGKGMFADRVAVAALVDNAGGSLSVGSDVKSRGVLVGRVTSLDSAEGGVRIGLELEGPAARQMPRSVQAKVLPATVFGTTFVDLAAPDGASTGTVGLPDGHVIRQDRSVRTLELQDTLDSTDRVLSAVEPAELATTLSSVAGALKGRGAELGGTLDTLENYLARLEPHLPLLQENLRLAAINLRVLADTSPDLLAAVDDGLTTTRTIVAKRRQLATTLEDAHELVETADEFVRDQKKQIIVTIANAAMAFDALFDHKDGLAGGFRSFVEFAERASEGFSDGPFLHTDVYIKTGGDVPYTSADCPRYGPAEGDNCDGGGGSSSSGGGAGTTESDPAPDPGADSGLIDDIEGLLGELGGAR